MVVKTYLISSLASFFMYLEEFREPTAKQ